MNGQTNGHVNGVKIEEGEEFVEGLVYPPPAIREIADKTAQHIGKRGADGPQLEEKIRVKAAAKFNFINPGDPYHAYYQHRLKQVREGQDIAQANIQGLKSAAKKQAEAEEVDDGKPKIERPPPLEFLLETPNVSPVDLDIIKLTALFVARSGRRFQSDLSQREKTNYQFDFLQPDHSLFGYFNRLVEQYTKVLIPDADRLARLSLQAGLQASPASNDTEADESRRRTAGRREVMKDLDARVQWSRYEGEQQKKAEDEREAERIAFAEIDWQDFVVAATVEFTEADEMIDLPAPMSLSDVANMSLKEKRKTTLAMTGEDPEKEMDEDAILEEAQAIQDAAQQVGEEEVEEQEKGDLPEKQAESDARRQADEIKTGDTNNAQVKIKPSGYIPRSKRNQKVKTTACSICGQQIPINEYAEHVRIELLDPRWKEKQAVTDANRSASTLLGTGSDVSASLAKLAAKRQDIFSELSQSELEKKRAEEEALKRKAREREAVVWDGHVASGETTVNRFQASANIDNQIRALHQAHGLTEDDTSTGPKIGPTGYVPPPTSFADNASMQNVNASVGPPPAFTPFQPAGHPSGTIFAAPQAGLINTSAPQMYNPYGVPYVQQAPMSAPMPMSAAPVSAAAPISSGPVLNPGVVRPLGDANDGEDSNEPSAKRQRLSKLPTGYHDEQAWAEARPDGISIYIQMPASADRPEWNCHGQQLPLEQVPVTSLVATLRDRIHAKTGVPIGRQQLRYNDRILTNSNTLASLNFDDNDIITLAIKEKKK